MAQLFDQLPKGQSASDIEQRESMLLDYAKNGYLSWSWGAIQYQEEGHTVSLMVMTDGIKLEGIRLSTSATLAQQIADLSGCLLPTPKICDIVYRNAELRIPPKTQTINATLAGMVKQNQALSAAIGTHTGVVADIGKDWVLVNALAKGNSAIPAGQLAANYGWHVDSDPWGGINTDPAVTYPDKPGSYVIQSVGTRHTRQHVDYSQISRLVSRQCAYDGQPADLAALLQSSNAKIVSHEGALTIVRQPGVAVVPGSGGGGAPPVLGSGGGTTEASMAGGGSSLKSQFVSAAVTATAITAVSLAARHFFG